MQIISEIPQIMSIAKEKYDGKRVLVPTMGALHEGHLSLCDRARKEAGDEGEVWATIFVNPTQFGPNEDLDAYPRQLEKDLEACRSRGVDLVFTPNAEQMYFEDASISIHEDSLSSGLCGGSRPGHFDGVCTVVAKLFNLTLPDAAVFGEKDYQQLAVIRRLVRDLNFPIQIIGSATVRESDGLAMSSRNTYLSKSERTQAPIIFRSLTELKESINGGEISSPIEAEAAFREKISKAPDARIDYIQIVHPETLQPLETFGPDGCRLITAVFFGKTRLIDNL